MYRVDIVILLVLSSEDWTTKMAECTEIQHTWSKQYNICFRMYSLLSAKSFESSNLYTYRAKSYSESRYSSCRGQRIAFLSPTPVPGPSLRLCVAASSKKDRSTSSVSSWFAHGFETTLSSSVSRPNQLSAFPQRLDQRCIPSQNCSSLSSFRVMSSSSISSCIWTCLPEASKQTTAIATTCQDLVYTVWWKTVAR